MCLNKFFNVQPNTGETVGLDGKVLKGSYLIENHNPKSDSHPAIMLVSSYIVERVKDEHIDKFTQLGTSRRNCIPNYISTIIDFTYFARY
ncbi:hypothetical protein [Nostoc sp.]